MEIPKKEAKERVKTNDLVNAEYILENSKIDSSFTVPENMVDEFKAIIQEFCRVEGIQMPKDYCKYLAQSFDKVQGQVLVHGPQKDWSNFKIIDTGVNIRHFLFDTDREQVLEKGKKFGVQKVIQVSSTMKQAVNAVENGYDSAIGFSV